jgi:hypothetical protein
MEVDAAIRMAQPRFPAVELNRQPLRGIRATPGPVARIVDRVSSAFEGLPQPFVRAGYLPGRIRVGGAERRRRQAQARQRHQPYADVREYSAANHWPLLLSAP